MPVLDNLIQIHEDLIEFGSKIQKESVRKFEEREHIESNVHAVFHKVIAYAITLHRAVLLLCREGWTHITPILLRTILDCSANCLAIIHNQHPEYMAFKYFYYENIRILKDNNYPNKINKMNIIKIEKGLSDIRNIKAREKAEDFLRSILKKEKIGIFWFKPEEKSYSSIIRKYGNDKLKYIYGILSMAIHGSHLGLFFFKDNPDDININPSENPKKTNIAVLTSCRLLLELLNIRIVYENLRFGDEYNSFVERILSFENELEI